MAGNSRESGTSVTSRALSILGAFDDMHRALSLTDIAKRAALPLATSHRLVNELAEWGALRRLPSGTYVIGRRLWELGHLTPVETSLRSITNPFLHDLYGATLATVHFAVREGTEALYLDRIRGNRSVPVVSKVGSRLPLHATGVGKVLLAYAHEDVQAEVLRNLTPVTRYTIIQPGALSAQLRQIREEEVATTTEEMSLGASSIAVPVFRGVEVVAALGLVVASLKTNLQRLHNALRGTAQSIGRHL